MGDNTNRTAVLPLKPQDISEQLWNLIGKYKGIKKIQNILF